MDNARQVEQGVEIRSDYLEKVTGAAVFASDVVVPDMLHGRILRSPVPHARIRSIDVSAALAMPGVVAILTGADLSRDDAHWGLYLKDRPIIAIDRVRYVGDPVAAVAAVDEFTAEEALEAIVVDYETLPYVTDAEEAMQPDAPLVHEKMDKLKDFYFRGETNSREGTNVFQHYQYATGDVEQAFKEADHVFEDRFTFPIVFHYAMEPHVVTADWREDSITLWAGAQTPATVQKVIAGLFGVPQAKVRVIVPYVGGGYGGKSSVKLEPLVTALSRHARAPVRVCLGINESMLTARRLSAAVMLKTAVRADGTLLGKSVRIVMNGGAYADTGSAIAIKAAIRAIGPYHIPNLKLDSCAVYTNTVPGAAYRSIGGPPAVWATESQMDIIAHRLGITPLEMRYRNMLEKGQHVRPDLTPIDVDMPGMMRLAVSAMDALPARPGLARGVAAAATDPANIPISNVIVRFKVDGSVLIMSTAIEIGQGVHGVMRSLAAKALGQSIDRVFMARADTDVGPYDWATGASRSSVIMGLAVESACQDIVAQVKDLAADVCGGEPEDWSLVDNGIVGPNGFMPLRELFVRAHSMDSGEFIGVGRMSSRTQGGKLARAPLFWETAVGVGDVDIDEETGEVRVARYVSAADVGKVLNRKAAEGQDEGAAIQALGHSLWEELVYEDGQPINASMIDYHVPAIDETPRLFHTLLIESGDGPGPGGARGMGEGAILPVAPVIANAIQQTYGARVRDLPLTPERVWRALQSAKKEGSAQ